MAAKTEMLTEEKKIFGELLKKGKVLLEPSSKAVEDYAKNLVWAVTRYEGCNLQACLVEAWNFLKEFYGIQTDEDWNACMEKAEELVSKAEEPDRAFLCLLVQATLKYIEKSPKGQGGKNEK